MTDIWDELWRRWDKGEVDPFALVTCFPDFIKKIRAEGDRLQTENDLRYEELKKLQTQLLDDSEHTQKRINELKEKAVKWDKAYSGIYDDEMPFTPERISLVMNFVNDHFPDFDTPKEFEDMITEYSDWETELTEAEDKLEAIKTHRENFRHSSYIEWLRELDKILKIEK